MPSKENEFTRACMSQSVQRAWYRQAGNGTNGSIYCLQSLSLASWRYDWLQEVMEVTWSRSAWLKINLALCEHISPIKNFHTSKSF